MSSRIATIVITAAVCLPLGTLLQRDAAADRQIHAFFDRNVIEDHPRLSRAQAALHQAVEELRASERANEALWTDTTGRAAAARASLERAVRLMDKTVEWLRNGMARQERDQALPGVP